jgi:hypothetical protein
VRLRHRLFGATARWVLAVASFGFSTMQLNGRASSLPRYGGSGISARTLRRGALERVRELQETFQAVTMSRQVNLVTVRLGRC